MGGNFKRFLCEDSDGGYLKMALGPKWEEGWHLGSMYLFKLRAIYDSKCLYFVKFCKKRN